MYSSEPRWCTLATCCFHEPDRRTATLVIARALTIAGSDSSGGAGVQADLKTFTVFGVYGMSALTALTAQNTRGVEEIVAVPPEFVARQIRVVQEDIGVDACKTGMLGNRAVVETVVDSVRRHRLAPLVVDPVMVAESGAALMEEDAIAALKNQLLPLARLVTPNRREAAVLAGRRVDSIAAMREAACRLVDLGAAAALIKGGHFDGPLAVDILHDGHSLHELSTARLDTPHTHGTGCMLAAAITAELAKGHSIGEAVAVGKRFITEAIRAGLPLGHGNGPANALAWLNEKARSGG